ncbi:GSCFA domain-containing protein [Fundidesulfovibrio agrisoli]|uniref:GSCFA domain-containing protein n=1 Tax=Fundidesulfovibrio agrisoli TaxID=2922717 RepID=UPI001FAD47BA|nr:GSCFA domain-containing protein [Fundidesulfovibrio agrisoli]
MTLADELSRIRTLFWLQYPAKRVLELPHTPLVADNAARFVCFGSCFASHMHDSLRQVGIESFRNLPTTFGYSFESLAHVLRAADGTDPAYAERIHEYADSLGGHNPYLFHFDHRLHTTREETAALLEREVLALREALRRCTHVVVTAGTPHVIRLKSSGLCINRSNGIPAAEYSHHRNTVQEELRHLGSILASVRRIRGGGLPEVLFTVSPQRYGFNAREVGKVPAEQIPECRFVENSLCKSILRVAVQAAIEGYPGQPLRYFPSYEIVLDELRSCEPFERDLMHVDIQQTGNHVVTRFMEAHFSQEMRRTVLAIAKGLRLENAVRANSGAQGMRGHFLPEFRELLEGYLARIPATGCNEVLGRIALDCAELLEAWEELAEALAAYAALGPQDSVLIWGTGGRFERYHRKLLPHLMKRCRVVLVDSGRYGETIDGITVQSPETLAGTVHRLGIIASTFREAIMDAAARLSIRFERIF